MVCKVKLLVMCFWTPSQEVSSLQEPADGICLATKSCQAILESKSTCYPFNTQKCLLPEVRKIFLCNVFACCAILVSISIFSLSMEQQHQAVTFSQKGHSFIWVALPIHQFLKEISFGRTHLQQSCLISVWYIAFGKLLSSLLKQIRGMQSRIHYMAPKLLDYAAKVISSSFSFSEKRNIETFRFEQHSGNATRWPYCQIGNNTMYFQNHVGGFNKKLR